MATFTVVSNVGQSSELLFPIGGLAGIVGGAGTSSFHIVYTSSGHFLRYNGTGLSVSGLTPTGGTYTSIDILDGSDTVLATLSGFGSANFVDIINNPIATLLAGADVLTGGTGDDFLSGYGGNDTINGGGGNDTISGGFDFDSLDGGIGIDTSDFTFYNGAVQWNMATGAIAFAPFFGTESAVNFENAVMGNGDDSITGSGLDNSLVGNGGNDTLIGEGGADTLDGGSGNDSLVGGSGNDVYVVDATTDIVSEAAGDTADEVRTTLALFTLGTTAGSANVERLTFIGAGGFRGEGSAAANVITGGTGDDELIGFAGADTLIGAGGNDTFTYFAAGDITGDSIDGGADAGGFRDSIQVAFGGTADFSGATIASTGGNTSIEYLRLSTGVAHEVIFNGSQFGGGGLSASLTIQGDVDVDTVTVNNVSDTLNLATLQFVNWTAGQDRLIVNATSQTSFTGASVAEEYNGSVVNDFIFGSTGADTLRGGDGRDVFIYSNPDQVAGDVIDGGASPIGVRVAISVQYEGTADFGLSTIASTATTSIEELFFDNQTPGSSGTTAIFRASQFGPTGLATNLALQDNSTGPATLSITDISGAFDVNAFNFGSWKEGTNTIILTVNGVGSVLTGSAFREEFNGGNNADTMRGGAGADTLNGNVGADVFRYLSAAEIAGDVIDGGLGSDTLQVEFTGAADFTAATIFSNVGPSIEALVLSGGGAHTVTFNASDFDGVNRLSTSLAVTGDNAGADTITINNAGFLFNLSALDLQGWQAQDRIVVNSDTGGSEVTGTAFSDVINGAAGQDTMYGTLGADAFRGAGGNDDFTYTSNAQIAGDTIDGGADAGGNGDVLRVNFAGLADFRAATILSTGQSSVELLRIGGGDHEIRFNGNQFGGNGLASTMRVQGNSGTDSLHFDNVTGTIDLSSVGFATWTPGTDLITITGVAGAQSITGSTQNDSIDGGEGNDTIIGGSGADVLVGGGGIDIVSYEAATTAMTVSMSGSWSVNGFADGVGDVVSGVEGIRTGSGADSITGSVNMDWIEGGSGNDTLLGGQGNDTLIGGQGKDILTGGGGIDRLVIQSLADSPVTFAGRDVFNTFAHGDKIDLSAIDARTNLAGDQAFTFIGAATFSGVSGQLRFDMTNISVTGVKAYTAYGDVNGDRVADFSLQIYTAPTTDRTGQPQTWNLASWDFVL